MRNLSFHLTTAQMRAKTKTVTRRKGTFWTRLKPGELVCAVEKSQGVKKGGLVRICVIRIVSVRTERLDAMTNYGTTCISKYGDAEAVREGFGGHPIDGYGFVLMFCKHMKCKPDQIVTRIEFQHTDLPVPEGQ